MLKITGKSPPGEKLAAGNDCSSLLFNVFHHHHCCQSLLGIKLHKIQALGNKHQCLSAYVKSQFFLYSNFAWKLLLGSCSLQLSPGLQRHRDRSHPLLPSPQILQVGCRTMEWVGLGVAQKFIPFHPLPLPLDQVFPTPVQSDLHLKRKVSCQV